MFVKIYQRIKSEITSKSLLQLNETIALVNFFMGQEKSSEYFKDYVVASIQSLIDCEDYPEYDELLEDMKQSVIRNFEEKRGVGGVTATQ